MKSLLVLIGILLVVPQWSNALEFKYRGNDVVAALLKVVIHSLPLVVHERLKSDIIEVETINAPEKEIASLNPHKNLISINQKIKHFKYEKLKMLSPSDWLDAKHSQVIKTKHNTLYHLLLGALIHEVFHYYDHKSIPHYEYLKTRRRCIQAAVIRQPSYDPECVAIQGLELSISDSPEFLQLAGFPKRGLLISENNSLNSQAERSPDAYEYTSPEEAFAVNMEFFLLDPEYQCRRPLLYDYFVKQFDHVPFPQSHCQPSKHVLIQYSTPTSFADQWQDLDFSKLYQIHYLWAGPGEESFSRFGHSMIRLVFCAKSRNEVGPECLSDIYAHRIISFRAAIDDMQINSLKGISGSYPSYLYMLSASDVINEYTRTELRTLYSLPLKLTKKEKERVLIAALEAHWAYKGNYKFLSNNCAHEALNLLQTALVDRPRFLAQSTLRPDSLYNLLIDTGVAEAKYAAESLPEAFPQLVFKSQERLFVDNVKVLSQAGLVPQNLSFADYQRLPALARLNIVKALVANKTGNYHKKELYAFLNLSELSLERLTLRTLKTHMAEFVTYAQKHSEKFSLDVTQLTSLLKNMMSANQIIDLGSSYGIPTEREIESLNTNEAEKRFMKTKEFKVKLLTEFRDFLPAEKREPLADEELHVAIGQQALPRYK